MQTRGLWKFGPNNTIHLAKSRVRVPPTWDIFPTATQQLRGTCLPKSSGLEGSNYIITATWGNSPNTVFPVFPRGVLAASLHVHWILHAKNHNWARGQMHHVVWLWKVMRQKDWAFIWFELWINVCDNVMWETNTYTHNTVSGKQNSRQKACIQG